MCVEVLHKEPYLQKYAHDHLKTQEMSNEAVHNKPYLMELTPNSLKTQEMCLRKLKEVTLITSKSMFYATR